MSALDTELDLLPGGIPVLLLIDLLPALEAYAAALPRPIGRDTAFSIPAGLPDRLAVPRGLVVPGRYQPRTKFDDAELDDLAQSIREHGILTLPKVFANEHGMLELIAGERRWRASQRAGLTMIPVEICAYTLRQIAEISAIDNLQRKDLSPLEEGTFYERLITELDISEAELSRRLSRNRAYIQQRRALANAAPDVQAALENDALTFSQARAIVAAAPGEGKLQKEILKTVQIALQAGIRLNEREVADKALGVVAKQLKAALVALGWSVKEYTPGTPIIWSPCDRPRFWSAAEMVEATQTKRKPSDAPPPAAGELTTEMKQTLSRHDRGVLSNCGDWIVLSGERLTFHALDELPALIAELNDEWDAMQARYKAAGWTLFQEVHGSYSTFKAVSDERTELPWRWSGVVKLITDIEANRLAPLPKPKANQVTYLSTCSRCKKQVKNTQWVESASYCLECAKVVEREVKAVQANLLNQVGRLAREPLAALPADALRLLLASTSYSRDRDLTVVPKEALVEELVQVLAGSAYRYRDLKVYEPLDQVVNSPSEHERLAAWNASEPIHGD